MRKMTPDWLLNTTWFVAGIAATGAFFYFLSEKNVYGTLWSGYVAVVVALLAIVLHIRNDFIRRENTTSPTPQSGGAESFSVPATGSGSLTPPASSPPPKSTEFLALPNNRQGQKAIISQTMVDSPGGIQVGGDLTVASDKRIIQSLVLEVKVNQQTSSKPLTEPATSVGLQSAVAFFTATGQRIRFVTDFKLVDQQVSVDTRRVTFVYTPETPGEILGKDIEFLTQIDKFVVNYSEIFQTIGFAGGGAAISVDLFLRLNGVEVIAEQGGVERTGVLARGQASFNVAQLFQKVPAAYGRAVSSTK